MSPNKASRLPASSQRYYTHRAAELDAAAIGQNVRVAGWVHRIRELGSVIFLEVRDASGVVQAVVEASASCFELVRRLRQESVVSLSGELVFRQQGAKNAKLPSGELEIRASAIELLSAAEPLPFPVHDDSTVPEELRLKYRYLDLRRQRVRRNILLRSRVIARLRELMLGAGFVEFQTPILTASSPEGARDFLVPSRVHPGKCYALPQAPQIFKQLLMVSGFDRYFQIAPCFRDEDARADRSPGEFYQLDVEMAFVEEDDIFASIEPVLHAVFTELGRYPSSVPPFPRIPYRDALLRYASDKPDLRNPLTFAALPEALATRLSELGLPKACDTRLLRVPNGATLPRRFFDERSAEAARQDAKLAWLAPTDSARGSLARLPREVREALAAAAGAEANDALFVLWLPGGKPRVAAELRAATAVELGILDEESYRFCWITEFPMYERNAETGAIEFCHNPFSMPQGGLAALDSDPLSILAHQYDIVCNGIELSSGALRNHRPDIMLKAFALAGYPASEVEARFGGLLRAFRHGAPPHGGLAPGIDRMLMLLAGEPNLREVIAFPLSQSAQDLMLGAPNGVSPSQLRDLHLEWSADVARR